MYPDPRANTQTRADHQPGMRGSPQATRQPPLTDGFPQRRNQRRLLPPWSCRGGTFGCRHADNSPLVPPCPARIVDSRRRRPLCVDPLRG